MSGLRDAGFFFACLVGESCCLALLSDAGKTGLDSAEAVVAGLASSQHAQPLLPVLLFAQARGTQGFAKGSLTALQGVSSVKDSREAPVAVEGS